MNVNPFKRMKAFFALAIVFLLHGTGLYGQCTPDPVPTVPGFYPDTFMYGCVGIPYSQVTTVLFQNDTSVGPLTIPFESYKITGVSNLPAGLTYQCDQSNCDWTIVQNQVNNGCVIISGTPTTPTVPGNDTVTVDIEATLFSIPLPQPAQIKFYLPVFPANSTNCWPTSITEDVISKIMVYPNPSSGLFYFKSFGGIKEISLEWFNESGRILGKSEVTIGNSVPAEIYAPAGYTGLIFLKVSEGDNFKLFPLIVH